MKFDISGLSPEEVKELMLRAARIKEKSDARRAKSGKPGRKVKVGFDPLAGRVVASEVRPDPPQAPYI